MKTLKTLVLVASTLLPSVVYAQQPNPTYIQIDGNKATAIKLLKESGIKAKDTIKQKYSLPDIKVTGNEKPVLVGDIVVLRAELDPDTISEGLVETVFKWTVLDNEKPKNLFVKDGGQTIAFGAGIRAKNISVFLDATCVYESRQKFNVVDKDGKNPTEKEFITEVKVNSPESIQLSVAVTLDPDPTPNPNPINPDPVPVPVAPVFPDGQFGLAKFAYETFSYDTNLDKASKLTLASKLADGLEGIAAKIVALQNYKDVPTILADTKAANTAAFSSLSIDLKKADPIKAAINAKISELWKNQKINTASDISIAWQEISKGLRAVK